MKFLSVTPPDISVEAAAEFLMQAYGRAGSFKMLESERDLNFRVTAPDGASWVYKIVNHEEDQAIVDCQMAALEHIASVDPDLPVPHVVRSKRGRIVEELVGAGGQRYLVNLLSYLLGEVPGPRPLGADQLTEVGRLIARLGRALRGFTHAALASRELLWDNRYAPKLLEHTHLIADGARRRLAETILQEFRDQTLPKLKALRAQPIHGDAHPYNILVDERGAISGVIDFGDMVHGALIQDLANPLADFLTLEQPIDEVILAMLRGYHRVTALEEEEIELLLEMVEIRLLQTPLINLIRGARNSQPDNYLSDFDKRCFPLLERLRSTERPAIRALIRRAVGLPAAAPSPAPQPVGDLLRRRHRVMGDKLYLFYDPPLHIVRGEGIWLYDGDGRRYLDAYNNVPHVGHCHPYVAEAIARQVRALNTNTRYLTDQSILYAERLTATTHPSLSAVAYVNSGSEANDVAWRMAKAWTGKRGGLMMEFAYHGITEAIDAFSPSNAPTLAVQPHLRTLPPPDDYRGPFKRGEADLGARYAALADAPIADLERTGYGLAAAMVDSAFMTNGMLEAPPGYLQGVVERVHKAGGLFIADEVQSGFGRMGSALWGHQHHGVVPDFVTIGKPAGNGHPIGVVITRPEILDHFMKVAAFFSTFGGNNVSCAAGLAVLDVIRDEGLVERAAESGRRLKAGLKRLMEKYALIGDVRGTGLALGIELVSDRKTLAPARAETIRLLSLVRDEGVLVGGEGEHGNIVKIRPPLAFLPEHVEIVTGAIDRALAKL